MTGTPYSEGRTTYVNGGLTERIANCEADAQTLADARALAEVIRDASDCAIGYETARQVLAGMDDFADEYASHIEQGHCGDTVRTHTHNVYVKLDVHSREELMRLVDDEVAGQ